MVTQHYRWDFVGLSTDTKPTPETSEKVVDGSTFYCSDTSKLYVFCKDTWYERKALGGGGGGTTYTAGDGIDITNDTISVDTDTIQEKLTAGTGIDITNNTISATGGGGGGDTVYSDKSTSNSSTGGAVYIGNLDANQDEQGDPTTTDNHYKYFCALPLVNSISPLDGSVNILGENKNPYGITIGAGAETTSYSAYYGISIGNSAACDKSGGIALGFGCHSSADNSIAIGRSSSIPSSSYQNSVALGSFASTSRKGEVNVGTGGNNLGYSNTDYRVIGGVHDPVDAHDAATKGYVDAHSGGGGGAIKLTAADYNYDTNGGSNYNTIAIWLLPDDIYQMPDSSVSVTGAISGSNYNHFNIWINNRDGKYFIKSNNKFWFIADPSSADSTIGIGAPFYYCTVNPNNGNFYVNLDVQLVTKSQLPS